MASEYTVFEGVSVVAHEGAILRGRDLGPAVVVTCPDREWDPMTIARPFATFDEAKAAGRELAAALKDCRPRGYTGFLGPRLASRKPEMVAARAAAEMMVRTWAGADAVIHSLNA